MKRYVALNKKLQEEEKRFIKLKLSQASIGEISESYDIICGIQYELLIMKDSEK